MTKPIKFGLILKTMSLSRQQFQRLRDRGLSIDQIIAFGHGYKPPQAQPALTERQQIAENYKTGKINTGDLVLQSFGEAASKANELISSPFVGYFPNPMGMATQAVGGVSNLLAKAIAAPIDYLAPKIGTALRGTIGSEKLDAVKVKIADTADRFVRDNKDLISEFTNPQVKGDLKAAWNLTQLIGTAVATKDVVQTLPELKTAIGDKLRAHYEPKYTQKIADDWYRAAEGKVKPTKILERAEGMGRDPIANLRKRGIDPKNYIQDGKLQTQDLADQFRNLEPKYAESVLDKSLEQLDYSRTPDSAAVIKNKAIANVRTSNLTPGQKATLVENIKKEFAAITDEGGGLNLVRQNGLKRTYWRNTFGDRIDVKNLQSSLNYQMGKALKQSIEQGVSKTTDAVNVKALNDYAAEMYDTANFLDSLGGKKMPLTTTQKLTGYGMRLAGTALGEKVGGVAGGVAGYYSGRILAQMLLDMPNPLRAYVVRDLMVNDPVALYNAKAWLQGQMNLRADRLLLPTPEPMGTGKNPIITPPPTTYEQGFPKKY